MIKLLRWLNILLVLVTLLCYLAPHVNPATFWPLTFFGLLFPWLLGAHLVFIVIWGIQRRYQFLVSTGCLLLGWPHLTAFLGLNLPGDPAGADFHIKSFNAYSFQEAGPAGHRIPVEALESLFPTEGIDILCLQEFPTFFRANPYLRYFKEEAGFSHAHAITNGSLAILSRYPIKRTYTHYFVKHFNGFVWADVEIDGRTARIFNLHLQSNAVSGMADAVARQGDLKKPETWSYIKGMAGRFKRAEIRRAKQAQLVLEEIRKSPHPVIVCGDFNTTPQSYAYHLLQQELKDGFRQAGTGLGVTYAGKIPALRIDYLLYSPALQIHDHDIEREQCSDHYSVSGALSWR